MKWALAGLTGVMCVLAIAPRELFFLAWFAYVPLLWAHRESSAKQAFLLAWVAGIVANLGNFYWIYELIVSHSALPAVLAVFVTFLLAAQQGLREALWLGLAKRFDTESWPALLTYPTLYVAIEFLYPTIFPVHLGDSQSACALTHQVVDIAGPVGLSWVLMAFNVGLFLLLKKRKVNVQSGLALGLLVLTLVYGQFRITQFEAIMGRAPKLRVGMVENNVGLGMVNMEIAMRQITLAADLAAKENPDLIVFPETAVKTPPPMHLVEGSTEWSPSDTGYYPLNMVQSSQDQRFSVQQGYKVPVLFGCTIIDPDRPGPVPGRSALHNGAFMLDEQGQVLGTALKNRLLVFGEYVPGSSMFPWIYSKVLTKASALYPGTEPAVIEFQDHRVGVTICYEDILPSFSYELLQKKPHLLINLTNDGWFGKTAEPYTHLALAQARAIEGRLYMVRSTSTGVSAFIDPLGRVMKQSDIDEPETLVADVAWMPGGSLFAAGGYYFGWLCVLLSVIWIGLRRKAMNSSSTEE